MERTFETDYPELNTMTNKEAIAYLRICTISQHMIQDDPEHNKLHLEIMTQICAERGLIDNYNGGVKSKDEFNLSLFGHVCDREIPYEHHETDLYIPITEKSTKLLNEYVFLGKPLAKHSTIVHTFKSDIEDKENPYWYEIFFAYPSDRLLRNSK